MSTPGTLNYPASLDDVVSLFESGNNLATSLSVAVLVGDATINVLSTTGFPSTGSISIDAEIIYYTGKTGTTFTGCVRGRDGTIAATHTINTAVSGFFISRHLTVLRDAIIAIETAAVPLLPAVGWTAFAPVLTASSGTWTGGTVVAKYRVAGKAMTVNFKITGSSISNSAINLNASLPAGYTSAGEMGTTVAIAINGTPGTAWIATSGAGGTQISIFRDILASINWPVSAGATSIQFNLTFEIQ